MAEHLNTAVYGNLWLIGPTCCQYLQLSTLFDRPLRTVDFLLHLSCWIYYLQCRPSYIIELQCPSWLPDSEMTICCSANKFRPWLFPQKKNIDKVHLGAPQWLKGCGIPIYKLSTPIVFIWWFILFTLFNIFLYFFINKIIFTSPILEHCPSWTQ